MTRKVRELERQRDAGTVAVTSRVTLATWLNRWVARRETLGTVRPRTIKGYRDDQRHIDEVIGSVSLAKLAPEHVERLWAVMVAMDLSVAHCRRTLMACLNDATARGLLVRNPIKLADRPRPRPVAIDPYTVEEMCALLEAAVGQRNGTRWTIALALGMRQGEVLGLCWDDIDLQVGTVRVARQLQRLSWRHGCDDPSTCTYIGRSGTGQASKRGADCPNRWGGGLDVSEPKSEAGRRVLVLPPSVVMELKAHRRAQAAERLSSEVWTVGPRGGWVFANETGGALDPRADARAFKSLCVNAGVPTRRLHDLRHSAATMMLENELDLRTAGAVLGHSQVSHTARYSHVLADRKLVAADRIEKALFSRKSTARGN
ncbi:MAG: tyrosine-type recombinase/integrase [Acidimicrobiales bacterium]